LSFKEYLGIKDSLLPGLATGFGGGIGGKGSLCGAFTGSIMVIGMKIGRADCKDRKSQSKAYDKSHRFWDHFEREFGTNICYNITQCHFDIEGERQKWLDRGGKEKCLQLVEKTGRMLYDFVNEF